MKKFLLLLVPMMYLIIFDSAYGWKQTQAYYPRVNPYYYAVPNQYRSYQSKPSRYNPYTQNNFPTMNRFMRPSSMNFGSPFPSMSNMGMSPMSGMGMSPMGFGSPFSPMSGLGMSPMSSMGFGSPFSASMPFQMMPWGNRRN